MKLKDVRVHRCAGIGSDHYLLTMQIKLSMTTANVEERKKESNKE